MFGRRDGDLNPRRFWNWFASESQGLANTIEALSRGEIDAERALTGLNNRIRRYDPSLEADVVRTIDGQCQMTVSGPDASVDMLLAAAPKFLGWSFQSGASAQTRRVPYRVAPRPSLDMLAAPISARHEAYA